MDTTTRSRRDLLRLGAGAAAGLAAGAAATLAAPAAALAADGDVIHVGDDLSGTLPTVLSVSTGNGFVVSTGDQAGHAVEGHALNVSGGTGVYGHSDHGFGVEGVSANATGVYGSSPSSIGVWGQSTTGDGVFGGSVDARGVYGASHNGPGLEGWSATGSALKTTGRLEVDRSGIATVAKGASIVKITVPGGVTSRALGFASLRRHATGVFITAVYPDAVANKLVVRLSRAVTVATKVSWFVVR